MATDSKLERQSWALSSMPPLPRIVLLLQEVNDGVAHGRYFFMDVAEDGIALYQADEGELHQPRPKTPVQALAMAKEYFAEWFPAVMHRCKLSKDGLAQGFLKEAAFDTHQTAEFLYHCVLLVTTTFYTPSCRASADCPEYPSVSGQSARHSFVDFRAPNISERCHDLMVGCAIDGVL